jgi:hypothetical protein
MTITTVTKMHRRDEIQPDAAGTHQDPSRNLYRM